MSTNPSGSGNMKGIAMVDHAHAVLRRIYSVHRARRTKYIASKLDISLARTYSDDNDVRCGGLSLPHSRSRPGQRDDMPHRGMITAV